MRCGRTATSSSRSCAGRGSAPWSSGQASVAQGVSGVEPPTDEVFGRTVVVADPDGNFIRVSGAAFPSRGR